MAFTCSPGHVALRRPATIPGLTGAISGPIVTTGEQDKANESAAYHSEPTAISTCVEPWVAKKLTFPHSLVYSIQALHPVGR